MLTGDLTEEEFRFHATATYASGGLVLSGDDLTQISAARLAMLRKLLPPSGAAAQFEDESLRIGHIRLPDKHLVCAFNWDDAARTIQAPAGTDYWTGERTTAQIQLRPHSAKLIVLGSTQIQR